GGEIQFHVAGEYFVAGELDPVVDDLADRVAQRGQDSPHVQHVVAQVGDPGANSFRRPPVDTVLQLVYLVVEGIDQIQVTLGDVVDEVVQQHRGRFPRPTGVHRRGRLVRRPPVQRGLPDRDQ